MEDNIPQKDFLLNRPDINSDEIQDIITEVPPWVLQLGDCANIYNSAIHYSIKVGGILFKQEEISSKRFERSRTHERPDSISKKSTRKRICEYRINLGQEIFKSLKIAWGKFG